MEKKPKVLYHGAGESLTLLEPDYPGDDKLYVAATTDRDLAMLKGFKRALEQHCTVISLTKQSNVLLLVLSAESALISRHDLKNTLMRLHSLPFEEGQWIQSSQHNSCWLSERYQHLFLHVCSLRMRDVYTKQRFVIKHPRIGEVEGVFD